MSNYFILTKCEIEGTETIVAILHDYFDYNNNHTAICYANNRLFLGSVLKDKMGNVSGIKFRYYVTSSECIIPDADEEFKRVFALEEVEGNED